MAQLERYSDEEKKALVSLMAEHKEKTADEVAEILLSSGLFEGRTLDALKQRVFKMRREKKAPRARAAAPTKATKAKSRAKTRASIPAPRPAAKKKPVKRVSARAISTFPIPRVSETTTTLNSDGLVELELAKGAKVRGTPGNMAQLLKSL